MEYEFEELTREIVVGRLRDASDAPGAAADVVREILGSALESTRSRQPPRVTVISVCRGAMQGLLQIKQDMPAGAVALIRQAPRLAHEVLLSPSDCVAWIAEGVASACRREPDAVRDAARAALELAVPGVGRVFDAAAGAAAE